MPHNAIKLIPGVDKIKTPALNQAAISNSNLIRFLPDRDGFGLAQKYGGWYPFYANPISATIHELWAWQDLHNDKWLAIGAADGLGAILNGNLFPISPKYKITEVAPNFTTNTTVGTASSVTVVAAGSDAVAGDVVWIKTQVSVGGLILFGAYTVTERIDANTFKIDAGYNATSIVANGGTLPTFATIINLATVTVTLANHGYSVGQAFPVLISTTVGGITLSGEYNVTGVVSSSQFEITANYGATSTTSVTYNSGNVYFYDFLYLGPFGAGTGYGVGGYGTGGYGSGSALAARSGTKITATNWFLNNYGQTLIASPAGGPIYYWQPDGGQQTALVIPNAPLANNGFFLAMPQRQIVAYGSSFTGVIDPLLIRWCDVDNIDTWIASTTNQAGSYRVSEGSKIVCAIQGPQQGLIWTDQSLWVMQYVGYPDVYNFNKLASGVGAISSKSAGILNNVVYWMSPTQFNLLSSNGVQSIACPVWDVVYQNLNQDYLEKIRVAVNSDFGEIAWFYPSTNSTENDSYVKYNTQLQQWDYGSLGRSAWIDQSVFGDPIAAGTDNYIYRHEVGNDAYRGVNQLPMLSSFRTGYSQVGDEADHLVFIDQIWPDMKWGSYNHAEDATVNITFYTTDYPTNEPVVHGPYTMTKGMNPPYISTRIRARLVAIEISSNDTGTFWRMGNIRYRYQADGRF